MGRTLIVVVAVFAALFLAPVGVGHPGSGIAVRDDGTVIFTDISRRTIWEVAPGGEPVALVRDRWTHSLMLGPDGALYYEREEPVEGVAPCSFWRLGEDGAHERLIAPTRERRAFAGTVFALDAEMNVYYPHMERVDGGWRARIMQRTPGGVVSAFTGLGDGALYADGGPGESTVRIVTAMASAPDGSVYFTDLHHVRRVETGGPDAGAITTVASGLIDEDPEDPPERRGPSTTINRLYGLAVDDNGSVFVAYQAGRRVTRVSAGGEAETLRESGRRWSPLGVALRGDEVYVLEVADGGIGALRVVRVVDGEAEVVVSVE